MSNRIYRELGTVAMELKGDYSSEAYYDKLNLVTYENASYVAKEPVHNENPSTSSKWQRLCGNGGSGSSSAIFNSVSDMKSADLQSGTYAITSGYYAKNDGGASLYLIRNADTGDTDDGGSIIILNNGKVAELIVENDTIHVMQFGIQENTDILTKLNTLASFVASADIGNIVFATRDKSGRYCDLPAVKYVISELKAKGLMSLMLSLPEDWDYTLKGLACICRDGVDSISRTMLFQLIVLMYI